MKNLFCATGRKGQYIRGGLEEKGSLIAHARKRRIIPNEQIPEKRTRKTTQRGGNTGTLETLKREK